jgi:endo-1,4-beta-D-glucanase Y
MDHKGVRSRKNIEKRSLRQNPVFFFFHFFRVFSRSLVRFAPKEALIYSIENSSTKLTFVSR